MLALAQLVITPAEGQPITRQLEFAGGKLSRIEGSGRRAGRGAARDQRRRARRRADGAERRTTSSSLGSRLHLEIAAGSRKFTSAAYLIKAQELTVTIAPPRLLLLELQQGATWTEVNFEALASPAGSYMYVWDSGDGGVKKNRPDSGAPSHGEL